MSTSAKENKAMLFQKDLEIDRVDVPAMIKLVQEVRWLVEKEEANKKINDKQYNF